MVEIRSSGCLVGMSIASGGWYGMNIFNSGILLGMVFHQPFSLFRLPLFVQYVNLCAHWRPSIYSLYVSSVAGRIQSVLDTLSYLPGRHLNW